MLVGMCSGPLARGRMRDVLPLALVLVHLAMVRRGVEDEPQCDEKAQSRLEARHSPRLRAQIP